MLVFLKHRLHNYIRFGFMLVQFTILWLNDLHLFDVSQQSFICHTEYINFYQKSNLILNECGKSILLVHVLTNEVYACVHTTKHSKH